MKKRGFTLIELLAVIVVLAIIALIATPIVMNVIKNAQMGAAERSADNYVKAVDTLIATNKLDGNAVADDTYTIDSNGNLTFGTVEVSGKKPVGGSVVVKDGQVVKGETTIIYEDYTVTYKDGVAEAGEGKELMTLADCDLADGTANTVGAKYTCNLGAGARTFYVLEAGTSSKAATLILEGNFDTTTLAWCSSGDDTSCNADGLEAKLDDIVENSWTKLDRSQIGIPSMEQIMVADGKSEDEYLDYPGCLSKTWLYDWDNEVWGDTVYGYWTSTPNAFDSSSAWHVGSDGNGYNDLVNTYSSYGIRPVITLSI